MESLGIITVLLPPSPSSEPAAIKEVSAMLISQLQEALKGGLLAESDVKATPRLVYNHTHIFAGTRDELTAAFYRATAQLISTDGKLM